jgi:uncharacterized protein
MTGADVVRELARRFQAGDRDGARALMHPDIRVEQPASLPHGGLHQGHAGLDRMGNAFAEHWDRTLGGSRILDAEPVVQITTQTWTARVTGRAATVDVVELMAVADGLVTEIRVFPQDTHLLLGLLEP